jgi:DNA topoisomerase-1
LFLAAESKLKGLSDKEKYERARRLKDNIGKVRQGYQEDMESRDAER